MPPRFALLSAMSLLAATALSAAAPPPRGWPEGVTELRIRSTADGSEQPALSWSPAGEEARPLLVGLHTWGGDYRQASNGAVFARWCMAQGWHFVFPHFRGPNLTPEALGSDLAVQDIADAVAHLRQTRPVDADRIYLIGASGGGHMAMLMAGRHPDLWAGVSAWVGISDVAAWHAEHLKNGQPDNYAKNIEAALGGAPNSPERLAEARRRSPLSWLQGARGVNLDLHHGLHDGRTGSVPFRHSLLAFNAIAAESDRLDPAQIEAFYATQQRPAAWPAAAPDPLYGDIPLHFRHQSGQVRVTIFEGGHEIFYTPGLNWLAAQRRGRAAVWKIDTVIPVTGDTASGR